MGDRTLTSLVLLILIAIITVMVAAIPVVLMRSVDLSRRCAEQPGHVFLAREGACVAGTRTF